MALSKPKKFNSDLLNSIVKAEDEKTMRALAHKAVIVYHDSPRVEEAFDEWYRLRSKKENKNAAE